MTDIVNVPRAWLSDVMLVVLNVDGALADKVYADAETMLAAAPKAEPVSDHYKLDLTAVIRWLENGCDTAHAVSELKNYQARLSAQLLSNPQQLGLSDPHMVFVNMLRGGIAKPSPTDIGALYTGTDAVAVVDEVKRQNDTMFAQPDAPKVEQGPVAWRYRSAERPHLGWTKPEYSRRSPWGRIGMDEQPLYTHPAPASDELLEALEPFAKAAKVRLCGEWRDDERCWNTDAASFLTFGDLRRAERLYDKHKGSQS